MNSLDIFNELSEHVVIRINTLGDQIHQQNWHESKRHKDYDMWYILEGEIEIRVNDSVYTANKGDLVLFGPSIAYHATSKRGSCHFIFTHFDFGLGNQNEILENFQIFGVVKKNLVSEESLLFNESYSHYKKNKPMSSIRLKGSLTILIAKVIELYGNEQFKGTFKQDINLSKLNSNLHELQPVLDYVITHLNEPLRNEKLSKIVGMSEKYFIYYFKQTIGVTPGRYIYQLKMNRARELVYSNQYSIEQIAEQLGYPDIYSFSKAFKKYYLVSPSQLNS
ncbi:putative DNA-binding protein [Bacillus sp. TS-2]|nr:putative DNA-binding protein [Bacillus sp. TS-2]